MNGQAHTTPAHARTDAAAPLLRLEDVGVRAPGGRWIIRHVNLEVHAGEIVTIIGPNGGGKTTTVRVAAGVLAPSEGRVARRAGLVIGYAPQKLAPAHVLPMSVGRFLSLGLRPATSELAAILERTGIAGLRGQQLHLLSSGELQRVLMARALLRRPHLLILDEPVQGVDFAGEAAIYDMIRDARARLGCGVLMVSHDLHFVMQGTDRVVCVNGHVCCAGAPREVSESAEYVALFGDAALVGRAPYHHAHDHAHGLNGCGNGKCE